MHAKKSLVARVINPASAPSVGLFGLQRGKFVSSQKREKLQNNCHYSSKGHPVSMRALVNRIYFKCFVFFFLLTEEF